MPNTEFDSCGSRRTEDVAVADADEQVQCDLLGALSDVEGVGRAELSLSEQVRAEAASAAKLVALSAARALEHEVIQDWSESEARHGVNPYEVIGARCDDPNERIEELFKVKVAKYTAGTGVAKILLLRAERSYALISDETKRQQCDERVRDRVASKSWAILRYANGLYEGGVNPFTMRDGWQPCRNGRGVTLLGSGEKYEGEYVDDVKHGVGLQFWLNGDMFLGQWRQDHMSGKGCYYYGNGSTYVGEFAGGRRHGTGTLAWPAGSTYSGQFVDGEITGSGVLELRPEASELVGRYDGEWKCGHMHGRGVFEGVREGRYEGEFDTSTFHGCGKLELPNGDVFDGTFVRGRKDGTGRYHWSNGDCYDGEMRLNHCDGYGVFESPRGVRFAGDWQGDVMSGPGVMQHVKENELFEYEGQWAENRKHGKGEFRWPGGASYRGSFASDQKHGIGVFKWADGIQWKGGFARDVQHGAGILCDSGDSTTEHVETYQFGEIVKDDPAQT